MKQVSVVLIVSLTFWWVPQERVEAQTRQPRRSLVGGTWHGTITRFEVDVQVEVQFHPNRTYTGTQTMAPYGPFDQPIVTHPSGKWWMEDANMLVMLGTGGSSFRGMIRWIDDNTLESYEPLTGQRVLWQRGR